jgi:hypothetical protein
MNNTSIAGVRVPDSKLAQAATELCEIPSPTFYSIIRAESIISAR